MAITLTAATTTAAVNAACNAIVDRLDAGAGNGRIVLRTAGAAAVATCVGGAAFFGAAADGVATQIGTAVDNAAAAGTVTNFTAEDSDGLSSWSGTVALTTGGDINMSAVVIELNAVVTLSAITFTVTVA